MCAPTIAQVLVRDENIQKLNTEIGKLKAKHQEKTKEVRMTQNRHKKCFPNDFFLYFFPKKFLCN